VSTVVPKTLIGNSAAPQFADMGKAFGFGLVFAVGILSSKVGFGQEYQHGTHAQAIYNSQIASQVFPAVSNQEGSIGFGMEFHHGTHAKAIYDSQAGGRIWPSVAPVPTSILGQEFIHGTHAKAIYDSQAGAKFWPTLNRPVAATDIAPICSFQVQGQELSRDLTIQGFVNIVPVETGWLTTMITAGPQLADLTVPAEVSPATLFGGIHAPYTPTTLVSISQADPTQIAAKLFAPPPRVVAPMRISTLFAQPDRWDPTVIPALVSRARDVPPAKYVQPAFVAALEPQFDKQGYPLVVTQPLLLGSPPVSNTGFRVTAVTAGWYGGVFRTPGDVFDILYASDYSDSTVNYESGAGETAYGWMLAVAPTTPLFNWLQSNGAPYFPPQDPNRRFIE
jgi:hypothetical protein